MNIKAYLKRIHYHGSTEPTLETLRGLHIAHLLAVPFENLDIHLGRAIVLDEERLFAKIVGERRGGFCYECNGLFAALLRELGFHVTMLSARVRMSDGSGGFGQEFDHLTLRVDLEEPYLADVGFGESFREPLRMIPDAEQVQPLGRYRLIDEGHTWRYDSRDHAGEWRAEYLFTLQPRHFQEFAAMCHWQQTSPDSPFTQKRVCSLATQDGRITVRDDRVIITRHEHREEIPLADADAYTEALRTHFEISLMSA